MLIQNISVYILLLPYFNLKQPENTASDLQIWAEKDLLMLIGLGKRGQLKLTVEKQKETYIGERNSPYTYSDAVWSID